MCGSLDSLDFSTDVVWIDLCTEIGDGWMGWVIGSKDGDRFVYQIRLVHILDYRTFRKNDNDELGLDYELRSIVAVRNYRGQGEETDQL